MLQKDKVIFTTMPVINEATDTDLKVIERLQQLGWKRGYFSRKLFIIMAILKYRIRSGMAKGKMARKKEEDVEVYRHEAETRKNAVPVGLASYDTAKPKPKKYEYDPHLDPQLEFLTSTSSLPFKLGKEKRIAPDKGGHWEIANV